MIHVQSSLVFTFLWYEMALYVLNPDETTHSSFVLLASVFDSAIFATSIQYRLAACHEGSVAAVMAVNPAA